MGAGSNVAFLVVFFRRRVRSLTFGRFLCFSGAGEKVSLLVGCFRFFAFVKKRPKKNNDQKCDSSPGAGKQWKSLDKLGVLNTHAEETLLFATMGARHPQAEGLAL